MRANISLIVLLFLISLIPSSSSTSGKDKTKNDRPEQAHIVVEGNNWFALDIYLKLSEEKGNVFLSPWSIYSAMAMTYEGARGKTADEMQSVMHFLKNDSMRRQSFSLLHEWLNMEDTGCKLCNANALWVQIDYSLLDKYTEIIKRYYHGDAKNLDFASATEEACRIIDSWVEDKTDNKIVNFISPGIIKPDTCLVLTNAIYFKGIWAKKFDESITIDGDFRTDSGKIIKVPMMSTGKGSRFKYMETKDLQMLEIPYRCENLSMLILLPRGDVLSLERSLTLEKLSEWKKSLTEIQVYVHIPKFKLSTKYCLNEKLKDMGMPTAFTSNADFSGINGMKDQSISLVVHQASIDVDEEGTEAAASTAVSLYRCISIFSADHPFIFMIQNRETDSILFIGRISDPSEK